MKRKNIIVGIMYRPPNTNPKKFLTDIDLLLDKIFKENKDIFLNLNLLSHSYHHACSQLLDILQTTMFPVNNTSR